MAKEQIATSIGFVGLGAMGGRVAGRLLAFGYQVYGTNRTRSKADTLIADGLVWRDTPREVAAASQVVFSMVTDDRALEAITSGPDGIVAGLGPGKIYIDMSTVSPAANRPLSHQVHSLGANMLDAPVSGSIPAAEHGSLIIMVGGDEDAYHQVEPLLRLLGHVSHVGGNCQALLLKLAINLSLGVQLLAFSEGVLLAERGGIDRRTAIEVMNRSTISSPMLQARRHFLLELPMEAWFDVELMQKDIRLALETADQLGVPLPSAKVTDDLLTRAQELGYGQRDVAAMLEVLERTPAPWAES